MSEMTLEEKVISYKKELVIVTEKLARKRTELSSLAKQKVDSLEKSIPALEAVVNQKKNEIINLEEKIKKMNLDISAENKSLAEHYFKAEESMKQAYANRKVELDKKESDLISREKIILEKIAYIKDKENSINIKEKDIKAQEDNLSNVMVNIEDLKIKFNKECALRIENIKKSEKYVDDLKNVLIEKNKVLEQKIKESDETIDKYKNLSSKLSDLSNKIKLKEEAFAKKEDDLAKREISLNEKLSKLTIDIMANNKKYDQIVYRESDVIVRENKVKFLEEKLASEAKNGKIN